MEKHSQTPTTKTVKASIAIASGSLCHAITREHLVLLQSAKRSIEGDPKNWVIRVKNLDFNANSVS